MDFDDALLISLVESQEALYDPSHEDFTKHDIKRNLWNDIGQRLKATGNCCKNRWIFLKHQYITYLKQPRNGHEERWIFENDMAFLYPYFRKKTPRLETISSDLDSNEVSIDLDFDNDVNDDDEDDTGYETEISNEQPEEEVISHEMDTTDPELSDSQLTADSLELYSQWISSCLIKLPRSHCWEALKRVFDVISEVERREQD